MVDKVRLRDRSETPELRCLRLYDAILPVEITNGAGGDYGEFRSLTDYAEMISSLRGVSVGRVRQRYTALIAFQFSGERFGERDDTAFRCVDLPHNYSTGDKVNV